MSDTHFKILIADTVVEIFSVYDCVHEFCLDYLTEGDRVRFLGNLGSPYAYEKYDKSNDIEIPCVSCGAKMDPRYDYCTACGSILLKGKV